MIIFFHVSECGKITKKQNWIINHLKNKIKKKKQSCQKFFNLLKIPEQEINIYIVFSCRFHVFRVHNIYVAIKPKLYDLF